MTGSDNDQIREVDGRLTAERATPDPDYRGQLRRRLIDLDQAGYGRPRHLMALVAASAGVGAGLLLTAFGGVIGIGPLA